MTLHTKRIAFWYKDRIKVDTAYSTIQNTGNPLIARQKHRNRLIQFTAHALQSTWGDDAQLAPKTLPISLFLNYTNTCTSNCKCETRPVTAILLHTPHPLELRYKINILHSDFPTQALATEPTHDSTLYKNWTK